MNFVGGISENVQQHLSIVRIEWKTWEDETNRGIEYVNLGIHNKAPG